MPRGKCTRKAIRMKLQQHLPSLKTSQKVALIAASTNNCRQLKTYTQRPMGQVAVSSGRLKLSQSANSIVQKLTQIRMNPTA